jgi:hypothetical protein
VVLEAKGIPTVTICSDAFISLAKAIAASKGMSSLRLVVIPHPIAGIAVEQVRAKADNAFDEIAQSLVGR